MNKLRVLFISPSLGSGGMERQLSLLLHAISRTSFKPSLALLRNTLFYSIPADVPVFYLNKRFKLDIVYIFRLFSLIKREKPDLLVSTISGINVYCHLFGSLLHIPVCCSIRNNNLFAEYRLMNVLNRIFPYSFVLCNSKSAQKQVCAYAGIASKYVAVVQNGVDTNRFAFAYDNNPPLAQINKTASNKFNFLFVGRIQPIKNLLFLLQVLSQINESEFVLKIVGRIVNRPYFQKCKSFANSSFKSGIIQWEPPTKSIENAYAQADCLILPSLHEGFPNVVLEALSCGIAVAVSESADPDKLVEEGIDGYRMATNNFAQTKEKLEIAIKEKGIPQHAITRRNKIIARHSLTSYVSNMESCFCRFMTSGAST
jgi:glycosyltransferase involved in cell wall biosynthesis